MRIGETLNSALLATSLLGGCSSVETTPPTPLKNSNVIAKHIGKPTTADWQATYNAPNSLICARGEMLTGFEEGTLPIQINKHTSADEGIAVFNPKKQTTYIAWLKDGLPTDPTNPAKEIALISIKKNPDNYCIGVVAKRDKIISDLPGNKPSSLNKAYNTIPLYQPSKI